MKLVSNSGAERLYVTASVSSLAFAALGDALAGLEGVLRIGSRDDAWLPPLGGTADRANPTCTHSADETATAPRGRNRDRVSA